MANQFHIIIPKPCQENWNEMTPTEKGAYCKSCQKNVIDFTNKTENEIYEIISNSQGETCGRFYDYQLTQPFRKTVVEKSFFNLKAIAASMLAFFSIERIFAGSDTAPKPKTVNEATFIADTAAFIRGSTKAIDSAKIDSPIESGIITLKGRVVDSYNVHPIGDARIQLKNSNIHTCTDSNGNFDLSFSESTGDKYHCILSVTYPGYYPAEVDINDFMADSSRVIYLFREAEVIAHHEPATTIVTVTGLTEIIDRKESISVEKQNPILDFNDLLINWEMGPKTSPVNKGRE